MSNANNQAAQNVADNAGAGAAQGEPQAQSLFQILKSVATRMIFLYLAMNAINMFKQKPNANVTNTDSSPSPISTELPGNMFPKGTKFDMYAFISESERFNDFNNTKSLYWFLEQIDYGNWYNGINDDGIFTYSNQIELSESMQNNGSIYLHVYFTETGRSPDPTNKETYSKRRTFSATKRLNKFAKKIYKSTKNLLTGSTEQNEEYQAKAKENVVEILSHWHPNLTINLVDDHTPWQRNQVPPPLNEFIEFDRISGKYYPIVYLNDYWNLHADYQPINSSVSHVNLTLTFSHLQLWKWQLYLSQSMKNQWYGGMLAEDSSDEDQDTIKRTLLDTNPYLLAITILVTLIHNVFEFLAFKNDIQFWRNKKSLEGLSVNSVLFGCVTQLIVLLYVLDNETNTVVRISVGIGLLIDLWKVPKVVTITLSNENKYFGVIPRVVLIYKTSYVKSKTNDYDKMAFKYLSWTLFPLVLGYAVYSLIYSEYKGWYSFVLSMTYGFLLTFGFIMMTPQLFINYKLKSVAHLPWRMMTYKALNTFIDDIFAFVIKMPWLYRIGCFRDDIIFFIYLYQRWIYPTDKKRTNEFGTSGESPDQPVDETTSDLAANSIIATDSNTQQSAEQTSSNSNHPKSE